MGHCFNSAEHARASAEVVGDVDHAVLAAGIVGNVAGMKVSDALVAGMSDNTREALGRIMPILLCGEESAVMVFTNLDQAIVSRSAPQAQQFASGAERVMAKVAGEEHFHEYMLNALVEGLQSDAQHDARAMRRRSKLFFMRLLSHDPTCHLARLSGLDSYVAKTLAALQCKTSALRPQAALMRLYDKIRFDEGGHVRITRDYLLAHDVKPGVLARERAFVAEAYRDLLEPYFPAFEALGVDSDRLRAAIN